MAETNCPHEQELCAFLKGELPEERSAILARHLEEGCPSCAETARRLNALPGAAAGPSLDSTLTGMPPRSAGQSTAVPDYEILGVLGRGGMGVVYKARHRKLNRLVALKMILHSDHTSASGPARFRTEAEAIARLRHPNIVQIYEIGEVEDRFFLALEHCEAGSLKDRLTGTPLQPPAAVALLETLARAVHVAHQAGIVHRDLKPGNVLLTSPAGSAPRESVGAGAIAPVLGNLVPKIADFGLAKKLDEVGQTQTGEVMGTPSYMAPEQAQGKKDVGPAADVYALGVIFYECLTGRPPFRAATSFDTISQMLAEEPVPPRRLNPAVPRDLETVCLKCLRKDPVGRYATALDLADDLERFRHHEPIRARPLGRGEKLWRWARRHPMSAGLLAAGLLAPLVALATLSLLSARLVRSIALESAAQQADLLEEANDEYSRIVARVEEANYPVNKTVPPTPGTVPLSIPATFLHDIGGHMGRNSRSGVQVRQYSDYPFPWRHDGGPRDEFERRALQRLRENGGREAVHEFTEIDGRRVVRYAQARILQRSCVDCHNMHPQSPRMGWEVGDVRGVLEIIRPLDIDEARVGEALRLALLLSGAVSALLLAGSVFVLWGNRSRQPVK
jgi:serine/threonine protein kinase